MTRTQLTQIHWWNGQSVRLSFSEILEFIQLGNVERIAELR